MVSTATKFSKTRHGGASLLVGRGAPSRRVARSSRARLSRPVLATKTETAPDGSKLVNGNRPTSPKAWQIMHDKLTENRVRSILTTDIEGLKGRGARLIDVRPSNEFEAGHIEGSNSVPLYQPIEGWAPQQVLRKAGFAFFGVFNGTEANENFEAEVKEAVTNTDEEIILVCNTGGTLEGTAGFKYGKQSRSLMAAYELLNFGYTKIRFLEGGMNQWRAEEREAIVLK